MKVFKFKKYLEYEILKINEQIATLETNKKTLIEKTDKILTKHHLKELKKEYQNRHKKSIFSLLSRPNKEKIIHYYVEEKTKEYNEEIQILKSKRAEFQEAIDSFQDGYFTKPFHPCNETLYLYLKYAKENNIPVNEFFNQIILAIKLNTLLYDNKIESKNQMKSNLSVLYDDKIQLREKKNIKTAKFIIKKFFFPLTEKNPELEKYLTKLLEEYNGEVPKSFSTRSEAIINSIKKPETIRKLRQQFILKTYAQNEQDTIITRQDIIKLSDSKLELINEALKIIKDTRNKNIILLIKRAIEDIISMEKYNAVFQTPNEYTDNEDITQAKTDTLRALVETYKDLKNKKVIHYYLKDSNDLPVIFNDIRSLDQFNYGKIMSLLTTLNLDAPKKEHQRIKNYTIYKTTYDNLVLYFTIKNNKIYIIKLGLLVFQENYDKIDFNIYFDEINKNIDNSVQKLYAAIIERELDITLYKNEADILLKTNNHI